MPEPRFQNGHTNADARSLSSRLSPLCCLAAALLLVLVPQGIAQDSAEAFRERVDRAIDSGIEALLAKRQPDGSFGSSLGHNALATLALIHAGLATDDPLILRLKRHILKKPRTVYDLAVRLMCIHAIGDPALRDVAKRDARQLVQSQGIHGGFHYGIEGAARKYDNSCTQFGILGLRAAHALGLTVPRATWRRALRHQLNNLSPSGGMAYRGPGRHPGFTAGALAALVITSPRTDWTKGVKDMRRTRAAIKRSKHLLARIWKPGTLYNDYALERAMALSGTTHLGKREWYRVGAEKICQIQRRDGGWGTKQDVASTCFALLFLTRASARPHNESPASLSDVFGQLGREAELAVVDQVVARLVERGDSIVNALVPYLLSGHRPVRTAAVRALRTLTGTTCGYHPARRPIENQAAIERWRAVARKLAATRRRR